MTKETWYKNTSLQAELQAILDMPVLKLALEICKDNEMRPVPVRSDVNLIDFFAIMGAKKEGYNEFLINLRGLAQPSTPTAPETKPWEYPIESTPNA